MRGGGSTTTSAFSPIRPFSPKANGATPAAVQPPISPGLSNFSTIAVRPCTSAGTNNGGTVMPQSLSSATSDGIPALPDLNQELAALSDKLIKAINHTTLLDDSLQSMKHELELSKARIKQLETISRQHDEMMAKGLLVDKKDVDIEHEQFVKRLREERSQRSKVEKEKKSMEQELEHLTTALFEEANKMVTASRKEKDAMDRKNEQLRAQLHDTELLLASHQEQLSELKLVLQQVTTEREESELNISNIPTPITPGSGNQSSKELLGCVHETTSLPSSNPSSDEILPTSPLSLPHLVQPVLRYDTGSYYEFCSILRASRNPVLTDSPSTVRLSSGSLTSLQVMGIGMGISSITSPHHSPTAVSNSSPSTPVQPPINPPSSLKETKFYKRVLVEDIEPTLRLDVAPGLSWLAKRNVLTAVNHGSLVIDPIPLSSKLHLMACCLCGESGSDQDHVRTHKMRTSEADTAQKYPLCPYCVGRLRATCDFLAFLRAVKNGLWKCETEDDERHAWDEAIKLRDRMFWARVGGGVVPAGMHHVHKTETLGNSVDQHHRDVSLSIHKEQPQSVSERRSIKTPPLSSRPTPSTPDLPMRKGAIEVSPSPKAEDEKKEPSYLTPIKRLSFGKSAFLDNRKLMLSPMLNTSETPQHTVTGEPELNAHEQGNPPKSLDQSTMEERERARDSSINEEEIHEINLPSPLPLLEAVSATVSTSHRTQSSDSISGKVLKNIEEDHIESKSPSILDEAPSSPTIPGSFW